MEEIKFKAIGTKIIVLPDAVETQTAGGVYIPDQSQEAPRRGIIQSVGRGYLLPSGDFVKLEVQKGDHVMYSKFAATVIEIDEVEYVVCEEKDILAVI
jgi:chaperonin GroES